MKKKGLITLLGGICLILVLVALPFMAACAAPTPAPSPAPAPAPSPAPAPAPSPAPAPTPGAPIELKAVAFLPVRFGVVAGYRKFIETVNERAKGELVIDLMGGPEVIPQPEQASAARSGVIDISWLPTTYYGGLTPAVTAYGLTRLDPLEERESGAFDYFVELHSQGGLMYLGRGLYHPGMFSIKARKPFATPYDLSGFKISKGTIVADFLESLGVVNVRMPDTEIYTALERGVIDGYIQGDETALNLGLDKLTTHAMTLRFRQPNLVVIMGLDKWNSLPKHLQDLIMDVQIEVMETWWSDENVNKLDGETQAKWKETDVEWVTFSPADSEWFVKTLYDVEWGVVYEQYPDVAPKMRELTRK